MKQQATVFNEEKTKNAETDSEYDKLAQEAYKEGVKDALKERVKTEQEDAEVSGRQEGIKEEAKEEAKKHIQAEQELKMLSKKSERILLQIHTLFPFDLFPDTICIDTNKVSITSRIFFFSESVSTVLLKEMTDVTVETALFLAQLIITYSHHPMKPMTLRITNLKRDDAVQAKEILQGLLVLRREEIDLTNITSNEIMKQLESLGKSRGGE